MRRPLRAAGLAACLGLAALLSSAAIPPNPSFLAAEPSGTQARTAGLAKPQPQIDPTTTPGGDASPSPNRSRASVHSDPNGTVRSITAPPGEVLAKDRGSFLTEHAGSLGIAKDQTLVLTKSTAVPGGDQVHRYQQHIAGLPVLGGEVVLTTNTQGAVRSALADTSPLRRVAGSVKIDAPSAQSAAKAAAIEKYGLAGHELKAQAKLWMLDASFLEAPDATELRPTWWVTLHEEDHEFASVLVDAIDGSIKLVASEHRTAKNRLICDLANRAVNLDIRNNYICSGSSALAEESRARYEGGAPKSTEVNRAYDRLGIAYDYFKAKFGRDSYDGNGGMIRATVAACDPDYGCPFQNAFWDGFQFVFGQGWATDDVAAHEYVHAVTDNASNLYYWYQSGAINEALSDIFGQFIDLETPGDDTGDRRWLIGEDLQHGAIRDMANPNRFGQPAYMGDSNWYYGEGDNGGVHYNSGVANHLAKLLYDGASGITALGPDKSAQLWYRVMHLLPSGSNYKTLGLTLKAACRELIGKLGFTPADCSAVETAVYRLYLIYPQGDVTWCGSEGQAPSDVFFDDMESGPGKWRFSDNYYWQLIPNSVIGYNYASSGRSSINGWTYDNGSGHGKTAETVGSFKVPSGMPAFLGFEHSLIKEGISGIGVLVLINNGSGWTQLDSIMYQTPGFQTHKIALDSYAGQSVKVRFQVISPQNRLVDWYVDDVRIYGCDPRRPGPPQDAYAYVEGTDLKIDWLNRGFTGDANSYDDYHYEFTYSPAIPGAPATFRPTINESRYVVTAAGADPDQRYTITMRVKMDNGSGLVSPAVTLVVDPRPPLTCLDWAPSQRFTGEPLTLLPSACYPAGMPRPVDPIREAPQR